MEWKIKPITEEEINKYFEKIWDSLTEVEKNYLREMHMTICVSNAKWRTSLNDIKKIVFQREQEKIKEKPENENEEIEESNGLEIDTDEIEPKAKKTTYKMNKNDSY